MANGSELLAAFSHPTRQAIVDLLRQRSSTVGELASQLPVTRPAVSQHLGVLKTVGLVAEERRGTRHFYRLNPKTLAELRAHIDSMWRDALTAFSDFTSKETHRHATKKRTTRAGSTKRSRGLPG